MQLDHLNMLIGVARTRMTAREKVAALTRLHDLAGIRHYNGEGVVTCYIIPLLEGQRNLLEQWLLAFYFAYYEISGGVQWKHALTETNKLVARFEEIYGWEWMESHTLASMMDALITLQRIGRFELPTIALIDWDDPTLGKPIATPPTAPLARAYQYLLE